MTLSPLFFVALAWANRERRSGAREQLHALGYATEVIDLGVQRAGGHEVREKLLKATRGSKFIEGLASLNAERPASDGGSVEHRIWQTILAEAQRRRQA